MRCQLRDRAAVCGIIAIVTRCLFLACAFLAMAACAQTSPATPATSSSGPQTITGTEHLAWDQPAGSAAELATFSYLVYVDGVATEAQGVSCATVTESTGFACGGPLPSMSAGPHALALSAYIVSNGVRLESALSAALNVVVAPQAGAAAMVRRRSPTLHLTPAPTITTLDGVQLHASTIADGLDDPADMSFASDGRIFIAERGGRILVFRDGRLQPAPALALSDATTSDGQGLLAIAVDPDYEQNHFIYIVYTSASGFRLARFRGVGDTLGDRAILMEGIASRSARPAASLRFGPDGKLYAGFDDAGDALRAADLGSFNGKILRLNADATTPADQAGGTPVYATNVDAPHGVDWDRSGATLWVADAARGSGTLRAVVAKGTRDRRGTAVTSYSLPDGVGVAALTFYHGDLIPAFRGDLLLAADRDHAVLRLRFDPADPRKVVATEQLLGDSLDGARTIGVGRDGAVYLCAAHTLIRLAPVTVPSGTGSLRSVQGSPTR
jgi:glucose/arabinose dehydrogenase